MPVSSSSLMLLLSLLLGSEKCDAPGVPDTYDAVFRTAAFQHWSNPVRNDWCELKARAMVESSFREDAVSPVGASGLLQVMPGTAADFGVPANQLYDAKINIHLAARIANRYWSFWSTPRSVQQQRELERASYNAGPGNIFAAQKLCLMPIAWDDISPCLEQVTGHHSIETLGYVGKIEKEKRRLQGNE